MQGFERALRTLVEHWPLQMERKIHVALLQSLLSSMQIKQQQILATNFLNFLIFYFQFLGNESTQKSSTPPATQCLDQNLFCGYWARIGECETESKFMKIFCKKSCELCDEKKGEEQKSQEKSVEAAAAYGWYSIA